MELTCYRGNIKRLVEYCHKISVYLSPNYHLQCKKGSSGLIVLPTVVQLYHKCGKIVVKITTVQTNFVKNAYTFSKGEVGGNALLLTLSKLQDGFHIPSKQSW